MSNLDAKLRVTTRAELKALHHRLKTTSIYVTHDQAEAMTRGDRMDVHLTAALGRDFIANIDPHIHLKPKDSVNFYLDMARLHIFEPGVTGTNVTLSG